MANEIIVRRTRPRVSDETLAKFVGARTGFVVDARGRSGAMDPRIKAVTKAVSFAGRALTVRVRPWDNLAAHFALDLIEPGDVLMMASGGFTQASVIGEKYLGMARNKGAVAIVVDGMARDVRNYDSIGIPVFALGVTPNSSFKNGPGEVGVPVSMGGVPVMSGDIIVGDEDGVVVIPDYLVESTAAALEAVRQKEDAMFAAISAGGPKPAAMAQIAVDAPVRYVD
ncbi:RraA family protein [Acuticoccus kandeliae]|uniref:RraA family protein n=1 Tax=Acuticoccus kandeliae TaxID=2073160 RepID=UPI000D3E67B4|nr:methyltransferase [Acuticoccus kandeliae]